MTTANAYMSYLAELAKTNTRNRWNVLSGSNYEDLGFSTDLLVKAGTPGGALDLRQNLRSTEHIKRLYRLDRLHATEGLLQLGWLWLVGQTSIDGKATQICTPLTSMPVSLARTAASYSLTPQGELQAASWLRGPDLSSDVVPTGITRFEMNPALFDRLTRLKEWATRSVIASGLPRPDVIYDPEGLEKYRKRAGLTVVATAVVYLERDIDSPDVHSTLKAWSSLPLKGTAFADLYGESVEATKPADQTVTAVLPLNPAQLLAMQGAAEHRVAVISGPPGTGKSHVVVALAVDQISRGNSVLIATQSRYAADVIERTLDRFPAPRFVRFGKQESRHGAATTLSEQQTRSTSTDDTRRAYVAASGRVNALKNQLLRLVTVEAGMDLAPSVGVTPTPGFAQPGADLVRAGELVRQLSADRPWTKWFQRGREREL
ncbi:MAG: AAA domain-containing protein, partial [Acidimicrobiia bacterium]|nr:AAA domain-containing protein [Acidimicrobiia bacterium]